jgi:hypothetical protein
MALDGIHREREESEKDFRMFEENSDITWTYSVKWKEMGAEERTSNCSDNRIHWFDSLVSFKFDYSSS